MVDSTTDPSLKKRAWWRHLNRYHVYVFALAALGWLFDTMDQMIFTSSRSLAMAQLLPDAQAQVQREYGGYVTSLFIFGWASGGLLFGILGDRWGRAKTMALTIFIYAAFTGLSALSQNWWQFGISRFLTGLGVGGEFAAGAALVAEVMPEAARARALGLLQTLSAVGNMLGGLLLGWVEPVWSWRGLYLVGAFPALLAVVVMAGLKEPEKWAAAKAAAKQGPRLGGIGELFRSPRWRRNTLVGVTLAIAGVIGLWGIGFYSPELIDSTFPSLAAAEKTHLKSRALILQQVGALLGMYSFGVLAAWLGRRRTFLLAFAAAWLSVALTFSLFSAPGQIWYLWPILGFGTFLPFGGYAIYFPELFPTRLRTTGTGFCYNVGRYVAASGPPLLVFLAGRLDGKFAMPGFRVAALVVASSYLAGMIALWWAPETLGQPLPEDE